MIYRAAGWARSVLRWNSPLVRVCTPPEAGSGETGLAMPISRDLRSLCMEELLALAELHKMIRGYELTADGVILDLSNDEPPMELKRMEAVMFLAGALGAMGSNLRRE